MFQGKDLRTFYNTFPDESSCMKYLSEVKWEDGYKCIKCGNDEFNKGNKPFYRRCQKCRYDESVTANTMFHKCKMGLQKAFEGLFLMAVNKKGISSCALKDLIKVNQKSAWLLRLKAQQTMASSESNPLEGEVDVDEFSTGRHNKGKQGRTLDGKKHAVLFVEIVKNKKGERTIGRAYAKSIDNFKAETLKMPMVTNIKLDARVKTDGYPSYKPLKKIFKKLQQSLSNKGASMPELHNHIMNIKNWLRGIHHQVSAQHYQGYLDEFDFRFNRRSKTIRPKIFHLLITRFTQWYPCTYQQIIGKAA